MPYEVFLSYSSIDRTATDMVCDALEAAGIRCWMAPRDILPGTDWSASIIEAIAACRVFVLVFSSHSNASPQVEREVNEAVGKRLPLVPFRIENTQLSRSMRYFLGTVHWLEATTPPVEAHLGKLVQAVQAQLSAPSSSSAPETRPLLEPRYPNNLPRMLTRFIGREREKAELIQRLADTPLLTLTGPGGGGKTRLALQVAQEVAEQYPDGVWLVELAALTDPAMVPQTVGTVLGLREEPGRPLQQTLAEHLRSRQLLLLLDNCEHLLGACAPFVLSLLQACPALTVLATSREALNIPGEVPWPVPSLSLPDPDRLPSPSPEVVAHLLAYDACRLFVDRAQLVRPGFTLTPQNAAPVAQICGHLDGIPLALELAAARLKTLSVEQVADHLDDRFRLLTGGSRAALPRQQTLRALIDWSYDLLDPSEQALLGRLSVFAGGWTLVAAEEVCADTGKREEGEAGKRKKGKEKREEEAKQEEREADPSFPFSLPSLPSLEEWEVLDLLARLVDKSLVIREEDEDAEARYRLLETIRQYAAEKRDKAGTTEAVRARHGDWYQRLVLEAEGNLRGPEQARWLRQLEREHDNLRAVLDWCGRSPERAERGLSLAGALWRFWYVRGYYTEGRMRLAQALEQAEQAGVTAGQTKALNGAGVLAECQCDYAAARQLHQRNLTLLRARGDTSGIASALNNLGLVARYQGDYATARALYEESLTLRRELGDTGGVAGSLGNLAGLDREQGAYAAAQARYEECLALWRQMGNRRDIALTLLNLGYLALTQERYVEARPPLEEGLRIFRDLGEKRGIALCLSNLGDVYCEQGDHAEARPLLEESLALFYELGDRRGAACGLEALAYAATAQGDAGRAARLLGTAEALREAIGVAMPPSDRPRYERYVDQARARSDSETFVTAWAQGRAMPLEQALAYARQEPVPAP